jgi:phosphohistidine phosphatase SixA
MADEELILIRHAHAEAEAASGRDIDRPLSALGRSQAAAGAAWLAGHGIAGVRVLCSPALRTRQTLDALRRELPGLDVIEEAGIYEATPGELISIIERHRPAPRLLLVGHNPGLESLVGLLADGRSTDGRGMPTGAIARLSIPATRALEPGAAGVVEFWWP